MLIVSISRVATTMITSIITVGCFMDNIFVGKIAGKIQAVPDLGAKLGQP